MHTNTHHITLPSLPLPLSSSKPRATRSPYPTHGSAAPFTPAHKAFKQLKSMFLGFRPNKTSQVLGAGNTQSQRDESPAQTDVPGGQLAPGHPITSSQPHQATISIDEFYGRAQMAKTSARFISTLLACPESLPSTDPTEANPDLAHFIAFALHRSRLPLCVHQYALHLIWRVKCLNPDFNPKHAHGTYLTALMLATKQSHDRAFSINDWVSMGQHIFEACQLRENEWRMCERLEWRFLVVPMDLVKLTWTIEVEYGELDAGAPPSGIAPDAGLGGMFSASVASSLSSFSTSSSECSLNSPWSGWGEPTPCGSAISTPSSNVRVCESSFPSPFILA